MSDRPGLDDTVVDNDRQERLTLRREQPVPVEPSWHDAGYRMTTHIYEAALVWNSEANAKRMTQQHALAHLRWATEAHHGGLTDQQVGQLARGLIAGLIDAGIAPEGVEV